MARITAAMNIQEVAITMSEGNPGALTCLVQMLQSDPVGFIDILYLDTLEIYGSKIYMLWNDCCGRDMAKLKDTINYFRSGKVSKDAIHANLNKVRAIPFI